MFSILFHSTINLFLYRYHTGFAFVLDLFVCLFVFLLFRAALWRMGVPRLRVKLNLHPPAYTTSTAT